MAGDAHRRQQAGPDDDAGIAFGIEDGEGRKGYDHQHAADGNILKTVDRSSLVAVQTPQIFDFKRFFLALSEINSDDTSLTDDNAVFEQLGFAVHLTETAKSNIKITVQEDLEYAEFLLRNE
jgi:2-C-methyl-D-erythritol 4-phosphate cytidylyltransferase